MRSTLCAILLTLLVITTHSLGVRRLDHFQSAADQQAYLNELVNIENSLSSQIQSFESLVGTVNKNVTSYEGLQTIQTQALQVGIEEERKKIYKMSSSLVLPIEKKTWDCKLLTQNQTEAINKQISDTQNNIITLRQKVDAEPDCQRNNQIQVEIEFLSLYVDHLAKQVGSTCGSTVTNVKTVYVPNSLNQYYVYGSQTQQNYNTNLQNLLNQGYTKLQCPAQAPYPKGNSCIGCPQDKLHFYDLTQLLCLTCPDGFIFQVANRTCSRKQMSSNTQAVNYYGVFPTAAPGLQTCPIDLPFWNGVSCIGCPASAFFDFNSMQCQTCPADTVFDPATHLCVYKRFNSNINANSINYCCGNLPHDANIATCPPQTPFFNGKQCIGCALPAYFSLQTMSCSLCPDGQGFSSVQRKCIDNKYFQVYYTSALTSGVVNYYGTPPSSNQTFYEKISTCPSDHPFFNGINCISCPLPNYFNFQSNKCEVCPAQFNFDTQSRKCMKIVTQQMNNNMDVISNFMGKIPDFNPALSTCPNDRPFYSGGQCISCTLPFYADFNTMKCTKCPFDYIFNAINRQCVVVRPNFYTDPKASNIFYNGNFEPVVQDIEKQKMQFVGIQQCPADKPYFDATTGLCIICPSQFSLFDIKFNRCIACTGQSFYNPESRICLLQGRVSATVERMMMNTVGWL